MNENKKKCKAWPLAAAALALGLGGVVGASAVYADRADDAANLPTAQSVKMRIEEDTDRNRTTLVVPSGSYVSVTGQSFDVDSSTGFSYEASANYGSTIAEVLTRSSEVAVTGAGLSGSSWLCQFSGIIDAEYFGIRCTKMGTSGLGQIWFIFEKDAEDIWTVGNDATVGKYNLNRASKGLIGEVFYDVTGGVTGVANTIGTSVTSVVGLFWDVENVRFTTLGTLTLVGLAAGLVYFAIRTIYRAVNGVA